jgi:glucose/arabinose dehydrogenase
MCVILSIPMALCGQVTRAQVFDCARVVPVDGDDVTLQLVTNGLSDPVDVGAPPGDKDRLFVAERLGHIRTIDLAQDSVLAPRFLDISSRVDLTTGGGLLGFTFHPDYSRNGHVFVNYQRRSDGLVGISRFTVSPEDPDVADSASELVIVTFPRDLVGHNGGELAFSPFDGYLYIVMGDGGPQGDADNHAQDPTTFRGKALRLDVDSVEPYAVPPDNPFVGRKDVLPEIWALGLRNPWRFSFDAENGDIYIADVGQETREEVNYVAAVGSSSGVNFQWHVREGTTDYRPGTLFGPGDRVGPVHEYSHGPAFNEGCSVTGGVVYRGCRLPDLHGAYFFADYCNGWVATLRVENGMATDLRDRTAELNAGIAPARMEQVVAFGHDGLGEVYVCALPSSLYRIVPTEPTQLPESSFARGNTDGDGKVDFADIITLLTHLFRGDPQFVPCQDALDVNDDEVVDVSDPIYALRAQFLGVATLPEPKICGPDPTPDLLRCETEACVQ